MKNLKEKKLIKIHSNIYNSLPEMLPDFLCNCKWKSLQLDIFGPE